MGNYGGVDRIKNLFVVLKILGKKKWLDGLKIAKVDESKLKHPCCLKYEWSISKMLSLALYISIMAEVNLVVCMGKGTSNLHLDIGECMLLNLRQTVLDQT